MRKASRQDLELWYPLECRAPSRLESDFQSELAEAVLGVPLMQTMPLPDLGWHSDLLLSLWLE